MHFLITSKCWRKTQSKWKRVFSQAQRFSKDFVSVFYLHFHFADYSYLNHDIFTYDKIHVHSLSFTVQKSASIDVLPKQARLWKLQSPIVLLSSPPHLLPSPSSLTYMYGTAREKHICRLNLLCKVIKYHFLCIKTAQLFIALGPQLRYDTAYIKLRK